MLIPITATDQGPDPLIGTTIQDRYEVLDVLGKGGMGVVYKGKQLLIDRVVAIKMLRMDVAYDDNVLKRFQVEAKAASRLNHPNVIAVYDFGVVDSGQPYLVMDFVEGPNLADIIEKHGPVDYTRMANIFMQACDALEHAHNQNIIHRDMKPSNIVLLDTAEQNDLVKVLDFGIAKLMGADGQGLHLTKTGDVVGSPLYMSPEQCTGQELDARSDIYSLGAAMYEALVGAPPLRGKTAMDTLSMHVTEPPLPFIVIKPSIPIPPEVEAIVMKCLEKDRNARFASMLELRDALAAVAEGHVSAPIPAAEKPTTSINDLRKKTDEIPSQSVLERAKGFLGSVLKKKD